MSRLEPRRAASRSEPRTHPDSKRLAQLGESVARGELVIPIIKRFPLAEAREAQRFAERGAGGKVLLTL